MSSLNQNFNTLCIDTKNEKLPKEVEIVHNGEVFIPKQVACGHRFTMVVATPQKKDKKIGNSDSISDDDHGIHLN